MLWRACRTPRPAMTVLALVVLMSMLVLPVTAAGPVAGLSGPARNTISLTLVADGLGRPVDIQAPPGDRQRVFIVDKLGYIRIVEQGVLLPTVFLDVSGLVSLGNEQGLLGLAFHPDFDQNGTFFVDYTDTAGDTRVVRYQVSAADPNLADPASAQTVLTIDQPRSNHNGGQLQFGTDGYLYISSGDGGKQGDPDSNGQRLDTLLGKILRIDVDAGTPYAIPPDNPFVADPTALDEIWSFGLRNPWRFSFDRLRDDMWIGDVGYSSWEEVDFEAASSTGGTNWGWNCREGAHTTTFAGPDCPAPAMVDPIYEYSHSDGCSITGGYVYRGSANSAYFGDYFFADYCLGSYLRTLHWDGAQWVRVDHTVQNPVGASLINPTAFGQDGAGNLYVADDSFSGDGEVFRLELRPATCVAGNYDVNGDGAHDVLDIQLVAGDWQRPDFIPDYDVNCSGGVDIVDVEEVAGAWGSEEAWISDW